MAIVAGLAVLGCLFSALGYIFYELTDIGAAPWFIPERHTTASLLLMFMRLVVSVASGGFIASCLSGARPGRSAAILGFLILVLALLDGAPPSQFQPTWYTVLTLASIIPAATGGGMLARAFRMNRSSGNESV